MTYRKKCTVEIRQVKGKRGPNRNTLTHLFPVEKSQIVERPADVNIIIRPITKVYVYSGTVA